MMSKATKSSLVKMAAKGKWDEGIKSTHTIRHFDSFSMDEPTSLGGKDTGATPLEYVAAALNGCKAVMIPLIAKEQNFSFSNLSFETVGILDARGIMGESGVRTYFQKVRFNLEIATEESDESLLELKREVERRCPVYNMFIDAGIQVEVDWKKI